MTRFARASGSKASNERVPNEPTPWCEMKLQLDIESQKQEETQTKSAKELLKDKDDPYYPESFGDVKYEWAEFDVPNGEEKTTKNKRKDTEDNAKKQKTEKNKKKKLKNTENTLIVNEEAVGDSEKSNEKSSDKGSEKSSEISIEKSSKKKSKKSSEKETITSSKNNVDYQDITEKDGKIIENEDNIEESQTVKKHKKKRKHLDVEDKVAENTEKFEDQNTSEKPKKKKKKLNEKNTEHKKEAESENCVASNKTEVTTKPKERLSKRQKRNMKKRTDKQNLNGPSDKTVATNIFNTNDNDNNWSKHINFGQKQQFNDNNKNENSRFGQQQANNQEYSNLNREKNAIQKSQKKPPKVRDNKEHKPRKPDPGLIKMAIDGVEHDIVKFEGFPIKKEDADRLQSLRKQMMMKGIPKKDIDAAMKLERRRAEKVLARAKKQVCFHCRKAGHNLSDCPELGKEQSGTGICFKCGSTEHTHFECRTNRTDEYRFAKCFICREQGHVARQCPDNPKGLYPDGGSCKICGDVTHLKKDCPDVLREKEETGITLTTINETTLESLDDKPKPSTDAAKEKKKIVKF